MKLLIAGAAMVIIGALIGERKGRAGAGAFFSLLLGPLGWLLIAAGPDLKSPGKSCEKEKGHHSRLNRFE